MPSTKKQATHRTLCRCLAKSFMSFCGIASFGMINIRKTLGLAVVSTLTLALSATTISLSTPAHAVDSASASTDVTLNLGAAISVRVLDSTATSDLSLLSFDLTPTSTGVTSTKTAVVDVSTSNVTGYKLYVEANGKDHNNNYTTDLVHVDQDDSNVIPTSTSTATNKNFWNYVNPSLGSTSVIPAHGTPDKINQEFTPTDSTKTNIDVNIGVDTNITAGTYNNQLLFTAIANASSMGYTLNFLQNLPVGADPTTLENFPENQSASSVSTSYTFTIPSTAPSLLGYNFLGFLDPEAEPGEKGSTEDPYQAGDDVVVNADTSTSSSVMSGSKTLSADWSNIVYNVSFDANAPSGATASGSTATMTGLDYNTAYNLTTNGYSITGYTFSGWCSVTVTNPVASTSACSDASGTYYADGAAIQALTTTSGATVELHALWIKLYTYTLNLNNNDGTTNKQILNYPTSGGTTSTSHTFSNLNNYAPTRDGYNFLGWATTSTGTTYYASRTLYSSGASSVPTSAGFPVTGNLYAIWESTGPSCDNGANRVCYISNEPSGTVVGGMSDQTTVYLTDASDDIDTTELSNATTQLTLYAPSWTLSGYGFKGWNTKADGTGTMYGPNETITLSSDQQAALGSRGLVMYAQWVASAGSMASFTQTKCNSLAKGTVTALTYGSDTYAIAKLADGKCWMIENLRTSTNAGTQVTTFSESSYVERQYNLTNITSTTASGPTSSRRSYGYYYSWASAINSSTAHTTPYGNPDSLTGSAQGICPAGWRLPRSAYDGSTVNAKADFYYLSLSTGRTSNSFRIYPNNFVFAGYATYYSSGYNRGRNGDYWSSTVWYGSDTEKYAFKLSLTSTSLTTSQISFKNRGSSVRCLFGS